MLIKNRTPQKPMTDKERKEKQRAKPKALKLKKLHELALDSVTFGKLEEIAKELEYQQKGSYSTQDIAKVITYCVNVVYGNESRHDIDSMADTKEAIDIYQARCIALTLCPEDHDDKDLREVASTLREYEVPLPLAVWKYRTKRGKIGRGGRNWLAGDVRTLLIDSKYKKLIEQTSSQ